MNKDCCTSLALLLARLSDLQAGYREAANRAADPMMVALLSHLFSTHLANHARLAEARKGWGFAEAGPGQVQGLSGRAFGHIGRLVAGADETVLPGLMEAEARMVVEYGHVIATVPAQDAPLRALLVTQRATLQSRIDMLRGLLPRAEAALEYNPQLRRAAGAWANP